MSGVNWEKASTVDVIRGLKAVKDANFSYRRHRNIKQIQIGHTATYTVQSSGHGFHGLVILSFNESEPSQTIIKIELAIVNE